MNAGRMRARRVLDLRRHELHTLARRSGQIVLAAAVVGAVTGLGVAGFERIVAKGLDVLAERALWVTAIAPWLGLLIAAALLRTLGGGASPATTDVYVQAFHDPSLRVPGRVFLARIAASIATLGSGGAMGMEGPSMYLGATAGARTQRRLRPMFRNADHRLLMVAGAAAGVAAIFKAPATGAIFALEVPYRDDLARRMLLPALVSAATGYLAFVAINGTARLFPVIGQPAFNFTDLAGALALGLAAGVAAHLFALALTRAKSFRSHWHPMLRAGLAGACLAGLFVAGRLLTGESVTFGPGYDTIAWTLDPTHTVWVVLAALALRCAATTVTVAGGGVGGLFIPLVVAGALTGRAVGGIADALDTSLFVVVGIAAFLGAGYRVPLAAVMFVAETTGRPGFVVPGLLAAVAAELVMGRASVSAYQLDLNAARAAEPPPLE